MRNILLPTDFSDNAWSAAVYALKLYANEDCMFYFLNSTNLIATTSKADLNSSFIKKIKDQAFQELSDLKKMARIANANANHKFEIMTSDKNLKAAINETIILHDIELVVMGTKGATGSKEIFFGSNTVSIINKIKDCPVLVVPDEFDFIEPKNIGFPTGYNRYYSHKELDPLKELSKLYNSKIKIVHINTEEHLSTIQEYNRTMLKEYLINQEHSIHWLPDYTKKANAINEFITDFEINILVMVNYKRSFIERLLHEPVIKKIGFHPVIPFLVIPC